MIVVDINTKTIKYLKQNYIISKIHMPYTYIVIYSKWIPTHCTVAAVFIITYTTSPNNQVNEHSIPM